MKFEGTVTVVEYLRGGVAVAVHMGNNGSIALTGLSKEEAMGLQAGGPVSVNVELTSMAEDAPAPATGDFGYGAEAADAEED